MAGESGEQLGNKPHVRPLTPEERKARGYMPNPNMPATQAIRRPLKSRSFSKESVALNVATAGAVAIMTAPLAGRVISAASDWVSEKMNRPQPAEVFSNQSAQDVARRDKKTADATKAALDARAADRTTQEAIRTTPTPTPSPNPSGTK